MALTRFLPEDIEELKLRFQGVLEIDNQIEELKIQTKTFSASKREALKAIAKKMDLKVKEVVSGYKAYIKSITEPQEVEAQEEVFVFIKEFNILNKEAKKE